MPDETERAGAPSLQASSPHSASCKVALGSIRFWNLILNNASVTSLEVSYVSFGGCIFCTYSSHYWSDHSGDVLAMAWAVHVPLNLFCQHGLYNTLTQDLLESSVDICYNNGLTTRKIMWRYILFQLLLKLHLLRSLCLTWALKYGLHLIQTTHHFVCSMYIIAYSSIPG